MRHTFNGYRQFNRTFPTGESCMKYLVEMRLGKLPKCPICSNTKLNLIEDGRRLKCQNRTIAHRFPILVGTILENSKLPILVWFRFIYFITTWKWEGQVTYKRLAEELGVSEKSVRKMVNKLKVFLLAKKKDNLFLHPGVVRQLRLYPDEPPKPIIFPRLIYSVFRDIIATVIDVGPIKEIIKEKNKRKRRG